MGKQKHDSGRRKQDQREKAKKAATRGKRKDGGKGKKGS